MSGESVDWNGKAAAPIQSPQQRERYLAAIALLLGPHTLYAKRHWAVHYLGKAGPEILPLLLQTLHICPELVNPAWPWWPSQYQHISRLLIQLSQAAHLSLNDLLHYPGIPQLPGPVLWTAVVEAAGLLPHDDYEELLSASLQAPWWRVRYAGTMALANRTYTSLSPTIRQQILQLQQGDPEMPVRLATSCLLLRFNDTRGLELLVDLLQPETSVDIRKAVLFILATELPVPLTSLQSQRLVKRLLWALQDEDQQIVHNAAHSLRLVATPDVLPELEQLLLHASPSKQLAMLSTLEELARRKTLRYAMQLRQLPKYIALTLRTEKGELRRQACYTLASLGGEYALAVLGMVIMDMQHPAHLEAIEALRLLPEIQSPRVLTRALHWLLHVLAHPYERARACALDTLNGLLWQARLQQQHQAYALIRQNIQASGIVIQLLASPNKWVRRRCIELLSLLDEELGSQRALLLEMLHHDIESSIRACIAWTLGKAGLQWAVPDLLLALLDTDEIVIESALKALGNLATRDNTPLIISAIKELGAYNLPVEEDEPQVTMARIWLKHHA